MNRAFVTAALCFALASSAFGRGGTVAVHGYVTKNGTYVAPYHRTAPDSTKLNNWSAQGNVNPYTGQAGTKSPYPSSGYAYSPAAQPQRVQFTTSDTGEAQAPQIPAGMHARVTHGAMYKVVRDGVNTYTNVPPPDSVGAKVLYTYVETCYECQPLPSEQAAAPKR